MSFSQGGVKLSTRETIPHERWLLIHVGELLCGGYFTRGEHLTVFPPCELAVHPSAVRLLRRRLLPLSRGVVFTYQEKAEEAAE